MHLLFCTPNRTGKSTIFIWKWKFYRICEGLPGAGQQSQDGIVVSAYGHLHNLCILLPLEMLSHVRHVQWATCQRSKSIRHRFAFMIRELTINRAQRRCHLQLSPDSLQISSTHKHPKQNKGKTDLVCKSPQPSRYQHHDSLLICELRSMTPMCCGHTVTL